MTKRAKKTSSIIALAVIAALIVCVGQFVPRSGSQWSNLRTVLQLGVIYALVAVSMALKTANTGYVLETGRITLAGTGRELLANESVKAAYLGT